jgi:hypothetical protein
MTNKENNQIKFLSNYDKEGKTLNSKFFKAYKSRFGELIDIFSETKVKSINTMLSYLKDNDIIPSKMWIMSYDLEDSYNYFQDNISLTNKLKEIKILGYYNKCDIVKYHNITFIPTNFRQSEHINIIWEEKNGEVFSYIWYEPCHYITKEDNIHRFGFEDIEDKEISKRFRPRLYKPSEKQLNDIINSYYS